MLTCVLVLFLSTHLICMDLMGLKHRALGCASGSWHIWCRGLIRLLQASDAEIEG